MFFSITYKKRKPMSLYLKRNIIIIVFYILQGTAATGLLTVVDFDKPVELWLARMYEKSVLDCDWLAERYDKSVLDCDWLTPLPVLCTIP